MSDFIVTKEMINEARGVRPERDYTCISYTTTLSELLTYLLEWEEKYPPSAMISLSEDDDESGEGVLYVDYQRPETDSEVSWRLHEEHYKNFKKAAKEETATQQRELAEYKRLAAKYGELK